jgi:hypothetical protein
MPGTSDGRLGWKLNADLVLIDVLDSYRSGVENG